jgi:hypothetical protein
MKNPLLKKILPHVIAVVIFLIVSMLFCKPALEGNVLNQHDVTGWKGMAQNSFEYKDKNGHYPLWNPNLFSGMPNYQVAMSNKTIIPNMVQILSFGLPIPINFFFLACVFFYILCLSLRIKPVVGILGGITFAFATYNAVIIVAGHETQMMAMAFMPLLIAGLILIFEKKYWLGLALTSIATYQEIAVNHFQVTYYTLLIAIAVTLTYLIIWIKQKDWKHIALAAGISIIAAIAGIAGNALSLMTTSEYAKYTMRGGKSISIDGDKVEAVKTSGLDTSYAFEYSLAKAEALTLIMPDAFGGASTKVLSEDSHVVDKLTSKGIPENSAQQLAGSLPKYWGGLPYTAGPEYLGVIICLLALIGFVILKTPLRWGLLVISLLGIFMTWGKNFPAFNVFLFEHLPLYNKFRAPSMAQEIMQLTIPLVAMLALQKILFAEKSRELLKTDFKKILYTIGGLFVLMTLLYLSMDYSSPNDDLIFNSISQQAKSDEIARAVISGMKADRKAMFGGQLLRALGFAILVLGILWLYIRNTIKPLVVAIVFIAATTIDLFSASKQYLNESNYISPDELISENFTASAIDQQILQDKDPDFRVFNMMGTQTGGPFSESTTSYFHKSVGGYHPAKLRTYQDVIEKYLSARPNPVVLNMLNTKYVITQDPQSGKPILIPNTNAFGHCWLVKNVKLVNSPVEAFLALENTDLKDTAIVENSFTKNVVQPQWDSASSIRLVKFDNDTLEYNAECNGAQFAVFSEIYYPEGWNAYVDGKKTDYCNVNYILRGISLPAGKHTVKFIFEPASYKKGAKISYAASFLLLLLFLGGLAMAWREERNKKA